MGSRGLPQVSPSAGVPRATTCALLGMRTAPNLSALHVLDAVKCPVEAMMSAAASVTSTAGIVYRQAASPDHVCNLLRYSGRVLKLLSISAPVENTTMTRKPWNATAEVSRMVCVVRVRRATRHEWISKGLKRLTKTSQEWRPAMHQCTAMA